MRTRWLLGAALVFLLTGLLAGAAFYFIAGTSMSSAGDNTSSKSMNRAEIEKRAHIRLPEGTRNLEVDAVTGGIDGAIYLRFELPTAQLATFVAGAGLTAPLSGTERYLGNYTGQHLPWWQPDSVAPFQSGNLIRDRERPAYALSLLASHGDEPWQTVYLFVTSR